MLLIFLILFTHLSSRHVCQTADSWYIEQLVKMLSPSECNLFLKAMSRTDEDSCRHIENLTKGYSDPVLPPRTKRSLDSEEEEDGDDQDEESCRKALLEWVQIHGKEIFLDRLTPSLQHIGRTDAAIGINENINKEIIEQLKEHLEGYHTYVGSLKTAAALGRGKKRLRKRQEL